jgi:hypothetical protein
MTVVYRVGTGKTVEFIERFAIPTNFGHDFVPHYFTDPQSNTTASIDPFIERTSYPQNPIKVTFPQFQQGTSSTIILSSTSPIQTASAATKPSAKPQTTFLLPVQNSTNQFLETLGAIETAAVKAEANQWLTKARVAVLEARDLRAAYHGVFRGLDILLRSARWQQVSVELEEICSERYPVEFGIGAMRFVSSASARIPKWNFILEKLANSAKGQGTDVQRAMRGLVEKNGPT